MENAFYFVLKALFALKIFKFLSRHFVHIEKNGLIRKIRLTSNFMTSQPGLQTIAIHIFSNISQSKDKQALKFSQLIERKKRNIFLQTHAENEAGRLVPNLFLFFKKA